MAATPRKTPAGTWRAEVQINGERHSKTFELRRQAAQWIRESKVDADRGEFVPPAKSRETLAQRADAWLALKESDPNLARSSWRRYESAVRLHIVPHLGDMRVGDITVEAVERWRNRLVAEASTATAKFAHTILTMMLEDQRRHGYITANPASDVDKVRHQPDEMTFLEPHELSAVVEVMDDWAADVVLGLALIGCRRSDLAELTDSSWDRINGRLHVTDRKTGNDRDLPVFDAVEEVLTRCLARGHDWLFATETGCKFQGHNWGHFIRDHFRPALEEVGVNRRVRLHDLRHTCASWLIRQGFGPVHVAAYLGHSNPSQTADTYAHLFTDDLTDMGDALDQMWRRAGEGVAPLRRRAQ